MRELRSQMVNHGADRAGPCVACGETIRPREAFDPSKILQGIDIACGKRPVPEVARQELVERVVRAVEEEFQSEVESSEVGRAWPRD